MTSSGKKKDPQEVSKIILQTAKSLFAEHGVETVSMHQVAKSAQIGQGTLYRRYANKSDLCMDVMKDSFAVFSNEVTQILNDLQERPVMERLCAVSRSVIRFLDEQFKWISIIQMHRTVEIEEPAFFKSPPYQFLFQTYHSLLAEALESRVIIDLNLELTAHMLISCFPPESYIYIKQVLGYSMQQIADHYCSTFVVPLFVPAVRGQ